MWVWWGRRHAIGADHQRFAPGAVCGLCALLVQSDGRLVIWVYHDAGDYARALE